MSDGTDMISLKGARMARVLEKAKLLSLGQILFSCVFKSCVLGLRRSLARSVGIPGTGKSLTAKATAGAFGLPLLRLDGQSPKPGADHSHSPTVLKFDHVLTSFRVPQYLPLALALLPHFVHRALAEVTLVSAVAAVERWV